MELALILIQPDLQMITGECVSVVVATGGTLVSSVQHTVSRGWVPGSNMVSPQPRNPMLIFGSDFRNPWKLAHSIKMEIITANIFQ